MASKPTLTPNSHLNLGFGIGSVFTENRGFGFKTDPALSLTVLLIAMHNPYQDRQTDTHLMASFPGQREKASTRKVKPIWILMKQETTGWQWHQLNHMQIICISLQTDNHVSVSSLKMMILLILQLYKSFARSRLEDCTQASRPCLKRDIPGIHFEKKLQQNNFRD